MEKIKALVEKIIAEWQSKHTTNNTAQYMDNEVKK